MSTSYKKLWKLLIDRDMNKTDLRKLTGISPATIAKLTRGEGVHTSILSRICEALNCDIGDVMEFSQAGALMKRGGK